MKDTNKSKKQISKIKAYQLPSWYRITAALAVMAFVLTLILGYLSFSGWPDYWKAYVRCGHKPIALISDLYNQGRYYSKGGVSAPSEQGIYFCTQEQAKAAGATAWMY